MACSKLIPNPILSHLNDCDSEFSHFPDTVENSTVDYTVSPLGLLKYVYSSRPRPESYTSIFINPFGSPVGKEPAITWSHNVPSDFHHNLYELGLDNLCFHEDQTTSELVWQIRKQLPTKTLPFFESYMVAARLMYPKEPVLDLLIGEFTGCLTKNGPKQRKMFENFWTLVCRRQPGAELMELILSIISEHDRQLIQELYGIMSLLPAVEEQIDFFGLGKAAASVSAASFSAEKAFEAVSSSVTSVNELMKLFQEKFVSWMNTMTGDSNIEPLGILGCIIKSLAHNAMYIVGKIAYIFSQGLTLERMLDLLSALGLIPYLTAKCGVKFTELFVREEIDADQVIDLGLGFLERAWKLDRGFSSITRILDLIREQLVSYGLMEDSTTEGYLEMSNAMNDIEDILDAYKEARVKNPRSLMRSNVLKILDGHRTELQRIVVALELKPLVALRQRASVLKKQVGDMYSTVLAMQQQGCSRVEPAGFCLLGQGGIGKSKLMSATITKMAQRIAERQLLDIDDPLYLPESHFLGEVSNWTAWAQNQTDQYFSGYEGQEVHIIDDAFQDREDKDHPQFFNLISSAPFPTNQAELNSKGRPYISKLMLLSANNFPTRSVTIRDVAALARRFQLVGVKFNGTQAEYEAFRRAPPGRFDSTYSHLKIYHLPAVDYLVGNNRQQNIGDGPWQEIGLDGYLDLVIDSVRAKENLFNQEHEIFEEADGLDPIVRATVDLDYPNLGRTFEGLFVRPIGIDGRLAAVEPFVAVNNPEQFLRKFRVARAGAVPFNEIGSTPAFSVGRVLATAKDDHARSFFRLFRPDTAYAASMGLPIPNRLAYRVTENGNPVTVTSPTWGPEFDADRVTISARNIFTEEQEMEYGELAIPVEGVYTRLKRIFTDVFGLAKDQVVRILSFIKDLVLPSLSWSNFSQMIKGFQAVYSLVVVGIAIFGLIFGARTLGDVPLCDVCKEDTLLMPSLVAQKVLVNAIHKRKCGVLFCSDECKFMQQARFSEGQACTGTANSIFFKKECAYAKDQQETMRKAQTIVKGLLKDFPDTFDPFSLAQGLSKTEKRNTKKWAARFLNLYDAMGLPVSHVFVGSEEVDIDITPLDVELAFESGEGKRLVRKRIVLESGEGKKIRRRKIVLESGEGKVQRRRKIVLESAVNSRVKLSNGESRGKITVGTMQKDLWNSVIGSEEDYEDVEDVAEEYGLKVHKRLSRRAPLEEVDQEASCDSSCQPQLSKALDASVFVLKPDGKNVALRGLPVSSTSFLLPAHISILYPNGSFVIRYKGKEARAQVIASKPSWDLALAQVDAEYAMELCSLRKFIPTAAELVDRFHAGSRALFGLATEGQVNVLQHCSIQLYQTNRLTVNQEIRQYEELWTVQGAFSTGVDSKKGDCGSPYMLMAPQTQRKLVGMHILGSTTSSYAALLTQERIRKLENNFAVTEELDADVETTYPVVANELYESLHVEEDMENLEYAPVGPEKDVIGIRAFESPSNGVSSIRKHVAHGLFPVDTKPAYLSLDHYKTDHDIPLIKEENGQKVEVNLVVNNTSKWCKKLPESVLITNELDQIKNQMIDYWRMCFSEKNLTPVGMETAVSGNPNFGLEPMNLKSSPGIPWNKSTHSKQDLVEETGVVLINGAMEKRPVEKLAQKVKDRLENLSVGKRVFSLWKDCLKDETRPVSKANQGKTRIFTAAPVDFTVAVRMLLGRFKPAWKQAGPELGHSVGIDPLSQQWGNLYRKLAAVSSMGFDCDFSNYDGNLRKDFMEAAIECIATIVTERTDDDWTYGSLNKWNLKQAIETLLSECVETFQQSGDIVWMSKHGNPSGNPMTTELNCTVNFMYHWFCFRQILGTKVEGLGDFQKQVGFTCFGDDAIYTIRDANTVTFEDIKYWMNVLGQEYTNAAKTDTETGLTKLSELSFLKRNFVPTAESAGIVGSPIELCSLTGQFNWCAYSEDAAEIFRDTYENTLIEMTQHGHAEFDKFVRTLHPCYNRHMTQLLGTTTPIPRFAGYRQKLLEKLTS